MIAPLHRGISLAHGARLLSGLAPGVSIQHTPNPDAAKFELTGDPPPPLPKGQFSTAHALTRPPTAAPLPAPAPELLALHGVEHIFFGLDFVTVSKSADHDWNEVQGGVEELLLAFAASSAAQSCAVGGMSTHSPPAAAADDDDDADVEIAADTKDVRGTLAAHEGCEVVAAIVQLLDERIRPHVQADGGDMDFVDFDAQGVVWLRLRGACIACPSSTVTMKFNVRNLLMHFVPEVTDVRAVEEDDEFDNDSWVG